MDTSKLKCLGLGLVLTTMAAAAKPPDKHAATIWIQLEALVAEFPQRKALNDKQAANVLLQARADSVDNRSAAAYALAFCTDRESAKVLRKLTEDANPRVAQMAAFAAILRDTLTLSSEARLARLSFELGQRKAHGTHTRLFLANWLAREHTDSVPALFLRVLQVEREAAVRHELLFHLVQSAPKAANDRIESELRDTATWRPDGFTAYALGCLTPGRSKSPKQQGTRMLLQTLSDRTAPPRTK